LLNFSDIYSSKLRSPGAQREEEKKDSVTRISTACFVYDSSQNITVQIVKE